MPNNLVVICNMVISKCTKMKVNDKIRQTLGKLRRNDLIFLSSRVPKCYIAMIQMVIQTNNSIDR